MAWRRPTNLREWLRIVFRHKKKVFFPAVVAMIAVIIASHKIPREYTATAEFKRETDAALQTMGDRVIERSLYPIRRAIQQDLRSKSAVEQLIEDLNLTQHLEHTTDGELTRAGRHAKEAMIQDFQQRLRVGFTMRTDREDRITVSFTDTDRERAPLVVNQLVKNYITATREKLDNVLIKGKEFYEREVARYHAKVMEAQGKKMKFQMAHPFGVLNASDPSSMQNKLVQLNVDQARVEGELGKARGQFEKLKELHENQPQMITSTKHVANPQLQMLMARLDAAQRELDQSLFMNRTEEHPAVIRSRKVIAELETRVKETRESIVQEEEMIPNTEYAQTETKLAVLAGAIQALEQQNQRLLQQIEEYEVFKRNFVAVQNDYEKIQRDLSEAERRLRTWQENLDKAQYALAADVSQRGVRLDIIRIAQDLSRPSTPTMKKIMMFALTAGLAVGLAMIVLAELLDHSFRSADQAIDDLKLPVLGTVNEIMVPSRAFKRRMLSYGVYPSAAVVLLLGLFASVLVTRMSLERPDEFERFKSAPTQYVAQVLSLGR